jgi:outer membrane protein assembly factor BamB
MKNGGRVWRYGRVANETDFYPVSDRGILWRLDAKTGQEVYGSRRIGAATYGPSPVPADGKIRVTSEDGVTTEIRAEAKFEALAECGLAGYTPTSPAIYDGRVFGRATEFLYSIGKRQKALHAV